MAYALIIAADPSVKEQAVERVRAKTTLKAAWTSDAAVVLASDRLNVFDLGNGEGTIIGTLFETHGPPSKVTSLDAAREKAILASSGATLIERYWGAYVAYRGGVEPSVLRDPSGALACYWMHKPEMTIFTSDVSLIFTALASRAEIDWDRLTWQLWSAGLPASATAIKNVREVLPGTQVTSGGTWSRTKSFWNPWDFVRPSPNRPSSDAIELLRRKVASSVSAWGSVFDKVLLGVSGGLDSSIVAACLKRSAAELHCLTMATTDPDGDERAPARMLCSHLGVPLHEAFYRLDDVDLGKSTVAHLPRPIGRSLAQAFDAEFIRIAQTLSIPAFFTGNGGDNVFGYSQSATAILDRLLCEGPSRDLLRTIGDICRLNGCSVWQAVRAASRVALSRSRSYSWRPDGRLLAQGRCADFAERGLSHPWLCAPPGALPGKSAHIASLLRAQQSLGCSQRSTYAPIIDPLMAQPVMEACLGVQSWEWCSDGMNRSIARKAFAPDLPEVLMHRRTKGGPDAFGSQIIEGRRTEIRERLLEGHLAMHGVVDARALERTLSDAGPNIGIEQVRILHLVDAEAWAASWDNGMAHCQ